MGRRRRPDQNYTCDNCGEPFDPVSCKWRCPACGYRDHCCDGGECT